MFVVDRSAFAVLLPLAMLLGAVIWSNRPESAAADSPPVAEQQLQKDQTVAANLPSR